MAIRTPHTPRQSGLPSFARLAWLGAAALLMAGSCTAPVIPPPVPQAQPVAARTRPAATASAPYAIRTPQVGWQDLPITPGEWHWFREGSTSTARFDTAGQTRALLSCRSGRITLERSGNADPAIAAPSVVVRTTSAVRPGAGVARAGWTSMTLAADDPVLDAIAFSRGRFAIEVQGMAPLPLPSWPEVARVIDDCRS